MRKLYRILLLIKNALVVEAKAYNNDGLAYPENVVTCYIGFPTISVADIAPTLFLIIVNPLSAIILTIRHLRKISGDPEFTTALAATRIVRSLVLVSFGWVVVVSAVTKFVEVVFGINFYLFSFWIIIALYIINSVVSGLVTLLSTVRNRRFLGLAVCLLLVLPATALGLWYLACRFIPPLNNYLPKDAPSRKRERLSHELSSTLS